MSERVSFVLSLLAAVACSTLTTEAVAQGSSLESASEQDKAVASEQYVKGMAAFQAGDAATALEHFRKSYQAVQSPNSHLMVGKALIDLGQPLEAYQELEQTAREADEAAKLDPKYEQTAQAARDELTALDKELVEVVIRVKGASQATVVRVNGQDHPASELPQPMRVRPGELQVSLVESGQVVNTESTNPGAGDKIEIELEAPEAGTAPAPTSSGPVSAPDDMEKKPFPHRRSMAYVAGGIGAAGLIGFGVFGLLNNGKYSDVEDECSDGICPRDARRDANRGHSYQTAANVSLIAGVVGAVTCVSLLLTEDPEDAAGVRATRVRLGFDRVTLEGSF